MEFRQVITTVRQQVTANMRFHESSGGNNTWTLKLYRGQAAERGCLSPNEINGYELRHEGIVIERGLMTSAMLLCQEPIGEYCNC